MIKFYPNRAKIKNTKFSFRARVCVCVFCQLDLHNSLFLPNKFSIRQNFLLVKQLI